MLLKSISTFYPISVANTLRFVATDGRTALVKEAPIYRVSIPLLLRSLVMVSYDKRTCTNPLHRKMRKTQTPMKKTMMMATVRI